MNKAIEAALKEIEQIAKDLAESSDDEGCSEDLIVVSREALSRLFYACTGEARAFGAATPPDPEDKCANCEHVFEKSDIDGGRCQWCGSTIIEDQSHRIVVRPDSDQPGLWVWLILGKDGEVFDGCQSSFHSKDDAVADAVAVHGRQPDRIEDN